MSGALIAALAALRRMLTPATLLLALLAGALAGAAVLGLPESSLAGDVFSALLRLLGDPPLLLLDEPFSGLDSLVLHDVRRHLHARLAEGAALVLASHRLEDFAELCTHVLVLRDGSVLRRGTAAEVLAEADGRAGLAALLGAEA